MSASTPAATFTDDRHLYQWPEPESTQVVFERFTEERDGTVRCEVTVSLGLGGSGKLAGPERLNLLSGRSIKMLANTLASRDDRIDWYAVLSLACSQSVERHRDGNPLEPHTYQADTARRWLLEPFLEADGWTVLYAQKGTAKSYLAMAISLSVATGLPIFGHTPAITGPVAYLDWEASRHEFDIRLTKLRKPLEIEDDPPIFYRFGESSLYSSVPGLIRRFSELGVVMAVIDSKSVAMSGAPAGEAVLEINRGIRRLGVPVLLIDHKSKAAIGGKDPDMAIGSVHTGNAARMVWSASRGETDGPGEISQYLKNTEANNGPRANPVSIHFSFDGSSVHITTSGVKAQPRVDEPLPVPY